MSYSFSGAGIWEMVGTVNPSFPLRVFADSGNDGQKRALITSPDWKFGIYRGFTLTPTGTPYARTIYHDNIRIGGPNATFSQMNPRR